MHVHKVASETGGKMSYKPMFLVDGAWYGNAQRFATREEAEGSALARWQVWTMARDHRADESDDPVNYRRVNGRDESIKLCPFCGAVCVTIANADGAAAWLCSAADCNAGASIGDDGTMLRELREAKS